MQIYDDTPENEKNCGTTIGTYRNRKQAFSRIYDSSHVLFFRDMCLFTKVCSRLEHAAKDIFNQWHIQWGCHGSSSKNTSHLLASKICINYCLNIKLDRGVFNLSTPTNSILDPPLFSTPCGWWHSLWTGPPLP
jgi:hypothetical protein